MIRALHSAATGLEAQQFNLDVIANNIANVNTNAFKKVRAEFKDLYYQTLRSPGSPSADGTATPNNLQVGLGVEQSGTQRIFLAGTLSQTSGPMDVAINGDGFFQITNPGGTINYTRDGSFQLDAAGKLTTSRGYPLQPQITVPAGTSEVQIGADGTVSAINATNGTSSVIGNIEIVRFANPAGLKALGDNLYASNAASGDAQTGTPGKDGLGTLQQGFLEGSNVQVVEEMVHMIAAQRAFEVNTKVVQAADEMLQMVNRMGG